MGKGAKIMGAKSKFKRHTRGGKDKVFVKDAIKEKISSYFLGRCTGIQDGFNIQRQRAKHFTLFLLKKNEQLNCGMSINENIEQIELNLKAEKIIGYAIFELKDNKYILTETVNVPDLPMKKLELGKILLV